MAMPDFVKEAERIAAKPDPAAIVLELIIAYQLGCRDTYQDVMGMIGTHLGEHLDWRTADTPEAAAERARFERTHYDSGECCLARHATAKPPWTCDCPCHDKPVGA